MSARLVLPALPQPLHEVLVDAHRFRVVNGPRQMGKDWLGAAQAFRWAWPGGRVWWVSNVYANSEQSFATAKRLLAGVDVVRVRESDRAIVFPSGGRLEFKTAEKPDNLRGATLDGLIGNEWAFSNPNGELWNVLSPVLAVRRASVVLLSTPNGVGNNWHALVQRGDPSHPSHDPEWRSWSFTHEHNMFVSPDEREKMRRSMPELRFRQEVCGEFLSGGGARISREWLREGSPPARMASIAMGVDLAISTRDTADWTAVAVLGRDDEGRVWILDVQRRRASFRDALAFISQMAERWRPSAIGVEDVGYQRSAVQELLAQTRFNVRAIRPQGDKLARFAPLEARYQQGLVSHAPRLRAEFVDELVSFPEGQHDDQVDACSLAWHVLSDGVQFIAPAALDRVAEIETAPDLSDAKLYAGLAIGRDVDRACVVILARVPKPFDPRAPAHRAYDSENLGPQVYVVASLSAPRRHGYRLARRVLDEFEIESVTCDSCEGHGDRLLDAEPDSVRVIDLDAAVRSDIATRLDRFIRAGRLRWTPIDMEAAAGLRGECVAITRNVSAAGAVTFDAPPAAMALACALRSADEPPPARGLLTWNNGVSRITNDWTDW